MGVGDLGVRGLDDGGGCGVKGVLGLNSSRFESLGNEPQNLGVGRGFLDDALKAGWLLQPKATP